MIECKDSLEFLKEKQDYEFDIVYSDPPYALGSEVIIKKDGKVDYKKASDFMDKWDMPNGEYWEQWFKEAYRTLKHGGYCIMFGMDRQLLLFKYYAHLTGFQEQQSLYWYFICNDDKTELLTKRGWLIYSEINKSDIVLTLNIETEKTEWQEIEDIHLYDVEDLDMNRFVNRDFDQLVTPNHRILHQTKTNPRYDFSAWMYELSQNLINKKTPYLKLPLSFENTQGKEEYGEKMCELFGWILTDGYYQKGDNSIRISQSSTNISKVEKIRNLLLSLNIDFKEYNRERKYTYKDIVKEYVEYIFYFNNDTSIWIRELLPNRRPIWNLLDLTFSERYKLFLGMMAGDGSFKMMNKYKNIYEALESKENFNGSFTKNEETVEFMQALCSSLGFSTSSKKYKNKVRLNISWKQTSCIQQSKNKIFKENYTGKVWSITTKNSNYCIRRNGKVSFTGNSNFPKATDLSKMIDKNAGAEREVVGKQIAPNIKDGFSIQNDKQEGSYERIEHDITKPATDLAKKYEGYKYSISPLKQTNETILIFRKPYLTGSCLHDTLAYENGDESCCCGALNINGNSVDFISEEDKKESTQKNQHEDFKTKPMTNNNCYGDYSMVEPKNYNPTGRYPAQTFIDSEVAEVLDKQSGDRQSWRGQNHNTTFNPYGGNSLNNSSTKRQGNFVGFNDTGGCSKILHKCDYEEHEHDIYFYNPKVSKSERNAGCEDMEEKAKAEGNSTMLHNPNDIRCIKCGKRPNTVGNESNGCKCEEPTWDWYRQKNNHPTLKPIKLNERILKLFKTPNEQRICYPFAGSGSEIIGGIKAGFNNWCGCEINQDYVDIANARIKYWCNKPTQLEIREGKV